MDDDRKIEIIADILDVELDDLSPEDILEDKDEWDSVAILSFIAMMDDEFDREVKGADIRQFITVKDAMDFMKA